MLPLLYFPRFERRIHIQIEDLCPPTRAVGGDRPPPSLPNFFPGSPIFWAKVFLPPQSSFRLQISTVGWQAKPSQPIRTAPQVAQAPQHIGHNGPRTGHTRHTGHTLGHTYARQATHMPTGHTQVTQVTQRSHSSHLGHTGRPLRPTAAELAPSAEPMSLFARAGEDGVPADAADHFHALWLRPELLRLWVRGRVRSQPEEVQALWDSNGAHCRD